MTTPHDFSITQMAAATGLTTDTLRWYEREGILPAVPRSASGHRRYDARTRDLVLLLIALRSTGMTTAEMKTFVAFVGQGAESHGRRIALLEQVRAKLAARRAELEHASAALETKISHYEHLIAAGLDCAGMPVPAQLREQQRSRS